MKKGFTMIELIFVIVILGILASVAIPRLAATRTDAEISATVANLRTLLSDINSYYVVKGDFTGAKWRDITNIPLQEKKDTPIAATKAVTENAHIAADGKNCILVSLVDRSATAPAYILFSKDRNNRKTGLCKEILEADVVRAFVEARVEGVDETGRGDGAIAIGSSTTIY